MALAHSPAPHPDRPTYAMAAAHPGDPLSPRHQRHPREAAHRPWPRVPGRARVARRRARTDRHRAGDDRRHRGADRAAGTRTAPTRAPPEGLSRADGLYGMGELTSLVTLCEL